MLFLLLLSIFIDSFVDKLSLILFQALLSYSHIPAHVIHTDLPLSSSSLYYSHFISIASKWLSVIAISHSKTCPPVFLIFSPSVEFLICLFESISFSIDDILTLIR